MTDKSKKQSAVTPKRNRKSITLETKQNIIKRSEKGETNTEIGHALDIPRTTIVTIKDKARILEQIKGSAPMQGTTIRQRAGHITEVEKLLIIWLEDQSQRHDIKQQHGQGTTEETFTASKGWFMRFKERANLHNIKVTGEAASADEKAAKTFPVTLVKIIEDGGYCARQVVNVDETGLYWKKMPSRSYIAKEEKSMPGFKVAKDRLTLLLGSNAAGDFKLKPLLVYLAENPRAFKGYAKNTRPVIWKSNRKTWVTGSLFEDWFQHQFIPAVQLYCMNQNLDFKAFLLLDNAPGHPVYLDDHHPNVMVVFMSPNTTSLIQPMDQGATDVEGGPTLKEFWKGYNILHAVRNIGEAWNEVKQSNLNGVWCNFCPDFVSDVQGLTETVAEVTETVVQMARDLNLEVETEDIEELLASRSNELSNEDLMQLEGQKIAEEQAHQSADVAQPQPRKSLSTKMLAVAFKHIDSALAIFEDNDPNIERSSTVSRGVSNQISCYREIYTQKRKGSVQTSMKRFFKRPKPSIPPTSPPKSPLSVEDPPPPQSSSSNN
ncbi:hypothetical protein FKM82_000895 [Ascaphus truei]